MRPTSSSNIRQYCPLELETEGSRGSSDTGELGDSFILLCDKIRGMVLHDTNGYRDSCRPWSEGS